MRWVLRVKWIRNGISSVLFNVCVCYDTVASQTLQKILCVGLGMELPQCEKVLYLFTFELPNEFVILLEFITHHDLWMLAWLFDYSETEHQDLWLLYFIRNISFNQHNVIPSQVRRGKATASQAFIILNRNWIRILYWDILFYLVPFCTQKD